MAANLTNRTETASHRSVPDPGVLGFELLYLSNHRPVPIKTQRPKENVSAEAKRIGVGRAYGRVGAEEPPLLDPRFSKSIRWLSKPLSPSRSSRAGMPHPIRSAFALDSQPSASKISYDRKACVTSKRGLACFASVLPGGVWPVAGADFRGETGSEDQTVRVGAGDPISTVHPNFDFQHRLPEGGRRVHALDR